MKGFYFQAVDIMLCCGKLGRRKGLGCCGGRQRGLYIMHIRYCTSYIISPLSLRGKLEFSHVQCLFEFKLKERRDAMITVGI